MHVRIGKENQFTLLELLVVVSIISALVAMLVPVCLHAYALSLSSYCKSNLRQLGMAFHGYMEDNRGQLMPYITGGTKYQHPGTNWPRYMYPYYGSVELLNCPASPGTPPEPTQEGFHLYDDNYGWNYDGTQGNRGPLATHVSSPCKAYLIFDSGDPCVIYGANNWNNLMEELDLDWDSKSRGANRHKGRVNVCFLDIHVESLNLEKFIAAPCGKWEPPWHMDWEGGILKPGIIPFPQR